jgi:hypothetical protein
MSLRQFRAGALPAVLVGLLLAAPGGLAQTDDAIKDLRAALRLGDAAAIEKALGGVVAGGGAKAMRSVLAQAQRTPPSEERLYWYLLQGAASFGDTEGLAELGQFLLDKKSLPIARDLLHALSANPSRRVVHALGPIIEKGPMDLQLLALGKLGFVRTPEAVDVLIAAMKVEEGKSRDGATPLMWVIVDGLTRITGQKFGRNSVNWEGWWGKHRKEPLRGPAAESAGVTGTAVDKLDVERRREYIGLEQAPKKGVIVLSAEFTKKYKGDLNNDKMEAILDRMRIPHEVVRREDFLEFDLKETGAILVNCAQFNSFCICPDCKPSGGVHNRLRQCSGCNRHITFHPALSRAEIDKIQAFVLAGGYLFCEDWTVKELVEKAFPSFVTAGEKLRTGNVAPSRGEALIRNGTVDVLPVRGMVTHPYLRGIFIPTESGDRPAETGALFAGLDDLDDDDEDDSKGRTVVAKPPPPPEEEKDPPAELIKVAHRWTIDDESFSLRVPSNAKVVPLLMSGDLQKAAGGNALVAVAFRPGQSGIPPGYRGAPRGTPGVVVQVLSHFGKQESRADEHSLENLLLNFLIDANVAREARELGTKKRGKPAKEGAEEDEEAGKEAGKR